jgi:hypothetical protein
MSENRRPKILNTAQQLMSGRLFGTPDGDTEQAQAEKEFKLPVF